MGVNFLDHGFQLADAVTEGLHHSLELIEKGGLRIPVLMDTQFGDVVRQFGATTAPTTSSNCG